MNNKAPMTMLLTAAVLALAACSDKPAETPAPAPAAPAADAAAPAATAPAEGTAPAAPATTGAQGDGNKL
jgi:uncharacterized lipoprotein YbaY